MVKLNFSTKAQTLANLQKHIASAKILPLVNFTALAFQEAAGRKKIIEQIRRTIKDDLLIVRSSSVKEDTANYSNAGAFESVLNVNANDDDALIAAIEKVIYSYESVLSKDEVLVQPMLPNVKIAGVAFTVDADTLAPYYIINYDDSGSTESVTSGASANLMTYIEYKKADIGTNNQSLRKVITACQECEKLFDSPALDIEFAITQEEELYIFQVRPIATKNKQAIEIDLSPSLNKIANKVGKSISPHPYLLGSKGILGLMPDWNPAEIIGLRPRRLAISLYKELITDNIWAYQRDNYGYRNLRSHPLLISLLGIPYVDVRVSFNSFIPKNLNKNIAEKLANFYLNKLRQSPSYHDKVEFEIIYSCYYLNLPNRLKELLKSGFNESEIKRIEFSLLELTNKIIDLENGLFRSDLNKINILTEKFDKIAQSDLNIISKIYWLIEDCKRYGTLPFAGLARSAFVAVQFLKSFVNAGIIDEEEYEAFMNSLSTVSKRLNKDLHLLKKGKLDKVDFLSTYGHLRPGTYDILSLRYDEDFENYFDAQNTPPLDDDEFSFSEQQIDAIEQLLIEHGIKVDALNLISFIREAIEARESSKFIFTKSLSLVLKLIEEFAARFDINREDASFLDIQTILKLYATLDHQDVVQILKEDIQKNKDFYQYTKVVKMPQLITNPEDIYHFNLSIDEPNFITLKRIEGKILLEENFKKETFTNKIAFIKSADPGYDYLFTKDIRGLVTQFGGANSHMAIRCAELGLPAIIGAGEQNFTNWSGANLLEIDCAGKLVRKLS